MIRIFCFRHFFPTCFFLFLLVSAHSSSAITKDDIQAALLEQLGYDPSVPFAIESPGIVASNADPIISNVYRENGFEPLWVDIQGPTQKAAMLLNVLKSAAIEGLDPEDYHVAQIDSQWHTVDSKMLASIDIRLTMSLHAYVSDLREGRLDPCLKDPELFTCARDRSIDAVDLTTQAIAAVDFGLFLQNQIPDNDLYRNLKGMLKRYREIEKIGGWSKVPEGPILKPGMNDSRVPLIRARLAATEYLGAHDPSQDPLLYDDATVSAVKIFQKRHGLDVDGIIGEATRDAMNIPVSSKIRQIVINMERLRWLSRGAGKRHVMVNIACFRLEVFDEAQIVLEMPVIVGKHYRETPVFSSQISYIEFNPFWNVPPSIAQKDILPKLKEDPSYLSKMEFHVFEGWQAGARELDPAEIRWESISKNQMAAFKLRQDPGPKNALGRVKFMFPNRFSVYLHDTPSQELFQRTVRTFSSGCIRLSKPLELAAYLLGEDNNEWHIDNIQNLLDSGARTVVTLPSPVPIHLVYLTVYMNMDGEVCFSKDIYGRDKLLVEALFENSRPD